MHKLKIPKEFYSASIIDNHFVSIETKQIWAIELDMLYQVQQICNKYNLKYWVDGGTMLGAVRHQGFIPWDDDIDIFMPREDYDKFIEVAQLNFDNDYFLQTDYTDNCWFCHTKIRKNNTTAILHKDMGYRFPFHQGIFIDIFPFDNVPDNQYEYTHFINRLHLIKQELRISRNRWWMYESDNDELLNKCLLLRDEYENIRKQYNNMSCSFAANLGLPSLNKDIRKKKSEYADTVYMKFEMLNVPVPIGYDSILKRLYGDYMKPVQDKSNHGKIFFDPYISYDKSQLFSITIK